MVVGSNVYVGALDGNLYKLNANTGNVIWKFETDGPILATPTIVDNKIYFPSCTGGYPLYLGNTSPTGDFFCLDANSGSVIWEKEIPYYLYRTFLHGNHMHASPTVAEGMVFVRNGFLDTYGLNASTGETIWTNTQRFNPGTGSQTGGVIQMGAPLYKYGRITTLCFPEKGWDPEMPYEIIADNQKAGLHTLVLLDTRNGDEYMTCEQAHEMLLEKKAVKNTDKLIFCYAIGSKHQKVEYSTKPTGGETPCCILVPGKVDEKEQEFLEMWK